MCSMASSSSSNKSSEDMDPSKGGLREIGSQAVWSLSSCKPGFGVDQLRDDSIGKYTWIGRGHGYGIVIEKF